MAHKYNFSNIYRQEKTTYIHLGFVKLQIKGRGIAFFLYLFLLLSALILFGLLQLIIEWRIAGILSGVYAVVIYYFIDYNMQPENHEDNMLPFERYRIKRKSASIIITKHNEKILVKKEYKTRGVVLYGLSRKFSADWERDCSWRHSNISLSNRSH